MITINDIWAWDPCSEYSKERIAELLPTGEITPQGICDLNIPTEDKIWALLHQHDDLFTDSELHLLACDFAEQALSTIDNPDPRSIEAIRVKRLWVDGNATDEELSAALSAALDAVMAADRDEDRDAAWDAAKAAARVAARDAAKYAANAAAWAAASAAARDAAWYAAMAAASAAARVAASAAARVAASAAARVAARVAAWDAAWDVARAAQLKYIVQKLGGKL